jgi:hypothetical protein
MPGMTISTQDLDTRVRCFDTRLREVRFLVNARKASRVKRLCGTFASPG